MKKSVKLIAAVAALTAAITAVSKYFCDLARHLKKLLKDKHQISW